MKGPEVIELSSCVPTNRYWALRIIWARDTKALLLNPGTLVVFWLGAMASFLFLVNYIDTVAESGLNILSSSFNLPVYSFVLIISFFLTLAVITTVAREMERGTLEILFYGPIDSVAYVGGRLLACATTYVAAVLLGAAGYGILAIISSFFLPASTWAVIGISIPVALYLIAFGICLSAATGKLRAALGWFMAIALLLLVAQFGPMLLTLAPSTSQYYDPVRVLREVLTSVNQVLSWVSPFGLLAKGTEAIRRGDMTNALVTAIVAAVYTGILTAGSVRFLLPRGVRL